MPCVLYGLGVVLLYFTISYYLGRLKRIGKAFLLIQIPLTCSAFFLTVPGIFLSKLKAMKYIFTSIVLLVTVTLSAQLKKGDINIGTSTNAPFTFRFDNNNTGLKSYDFTFTPSVGYFLKNRLEIGGGPSLSFTGTKYKGGTSSVSFKSNSQSYGLNFYTRYYLKEQGKLIPYLTANATYLRTSAQSIDPGGLKSSYKFNQWQIGAGAGVSWFITPKAALFSELTYTGNWGGGSGYTNGLKLNVGFQIYLGRKEKK